MKKPTRWISQANPAILLAAILLFGAFGLAQKTKPLQQKKTSPLQSCKKTNLPKVCESLVQLYQSNDIPFVIPSQDVCSWNEVGCNPEKNQVIELQFSNKHFKVLPEGVFAGLSSLQRLYLYNNQLQTLPEGVFAGLSSLQGLYLDNNQLKTLPTGVFAGLSSLKKLDLQRNPLPASFKLSQTLCTQASIFPQTLCPSSR